MSLRTHCRTSGWSLTEQDPFNNVTRTCLEAMAAALGHTQSLHTNALDEAIALPSDFWARIARNTQLYLQDETCRWKVINPWAGSYFVEALTADLAKRAWSHIQEVESWAAWPRPSRSVCPKGASRRLPPAARPHRFRPGNHRRSQQVPSDQGGTTGNSGHRQYRGAGSAA